MHWGALLTIVIPSQVECLRPQTQAQTLSFILGIGAAIALVVTPLAGALSDRNASRWGRRRPFLAVGTTVNCCGLGVMLWASLHPSLAMYVCGYVIVQFGNNVAGGAYAGFIPDLVPPNQRGEASGYMAAMTQLGTVAGALGGGFLTAAGHVTVCFTVLAVTLVALMIATLWTVPETPIPPSSTALSLRRLVGDMWIDPRRFPDFAWVWVSRFLAIAGIWMVQPFLLYYMRDVIGAPKPEVQTGVMMASMLLGATVTGWLAGRYSDRVGRKRVVYAANSILALAILLLLFSHNLAFTLGVGVFFGLGYGAYYSVDWALACDVLPDQDNAGRYLGVWNVAMVLPQTVAPVIAGTLLTVFGRGRLQGRYTLEGYSTVFVLAASTLLLGAWLLRNVRSAR